jgi:two-component system, cell cycle response regulator
MRSNLLLIFSNKKELETLSKSLQPSYNVFEASSREETSQIVEVISVQLIIYGVERDCPDGWEFCKQLKSSPAWSHIPLIVMSGDDSLSVKLKSLEVGADAFIGTTTQSIYLEALIKNLIVNRIRVTEHILKPKTAAPQDTDLIPDDDFMQKLNDQIACHLPDSSLNVDLLARLMNMSRPTLYRKIKTITDLTPNDLIHVARLKRAARLLADGKYKVYEIARMVGFQTQSSFGKAFIKQFKVTPTQYLQVKKKEGERREGLHRLLTH